MGTHRLVATLLAEGLAIDQITGRLTAFNMLESIFVPRLPAALGKLAVITLYEMEGDGAGHWQRVTIRGPDGSEIARSETELVGEGELHRSLGIFQGLRFERAGVYRVVVETARTQGGPWQVVGDRRLHVALRPHPLAEGASAATVGSGTPFAD